MANSIRLEFSYSIPDLLVDKVEISAPYQNYNARGNPTSFGVDMTFAEMDLSKTLKSSDFRLLRGKIQDTLRAWLAKYERHLETQHKGQRASSVDDMKREAEQTIEELDGILAHTLSINDEDVPVVVEK